MLPIKQAEKSYYNQFSAFLDKYEDTKNKSTIGELAHIKLVSAEDQGGLKNKLEAIGTQFQNPFIHISNWIKGEVYTLEALIVCVAYMQGVESWKQKVIRDIKDIEETIVKLNSGKFTFGSMFKDEAGKKQQAIEKAQLKAELEQDVININVIGKILTIYVATIAIPDFQKNAKLRYVVAMGRMCSSEVSNAETLTDCWASFKTHIDSHGIKY